MKTLVTGGSGLVGKSLKKILPDAVYLSSKDFDLTNEKDVINMFQKFKPSRIVHLAARVGGILDNINRPAEYFTDNILMNTLLLKYSYEFSVQRFTGILSTCIYPDEVSTYPLTEDMLHLGPPTPTNFSYGYAKRSLAVQIESYNKQYGTKYNYLTPCNLFGEGDKNQIHNSHFVTALIKKIYDAKTTNQNYIELFGDGTPLRQFMTAEDFSKVIKFVIDNDIVDNFNVATEETLSIKEIAEIALKACDANHLKIKWNTSMPNGQFRKDVSIEKLKNIYKDFKAESLESGIRKTYDKFSQ
jgi:GDP-L-fucose synthase